jgi:hypothetical protein
VIRALWDVERPGRARYDGKYHRLSGSERGPAPVHNVGIWVGAYKPRMLDLTGRKADGWLPSLPYLEPGQLASGNEAIDEAAAEAGRNPSQIRRILNISGSFSGAGPGPVGGPAARWVEELTRLALEDGVGTFILMADDANKIQTFAEEVAPGVREAVAAQRSKAGAIPPNGSSAGLPAVAAVATADESEMPGPRSTRWPSARTTGRSGHFARATAARWRSTTAWRMTRSSPISRAAT